MITTHYIEEARDAANVAFMNYGTILRQSNPHKLLQEFSCKTLEMVFLLLCEQRTNLDSKPVKPSEEEPIAEEQEKSSELTKDNLQLEEIKERKTNKKLDFMRIKAMIQKYYTLSIRNPMFLYIFYFIPIIELTFIKLTLGQIPAHIPIAIYNEDHSSNYSDAMIDSFDSYHMDVRMAATNQSAFDSVVNGSNYMAVIFGQNFSESFESRIKNVFQVTDEELDNSEIQVYADFSNASMAVMTIKYLLQAFNGLLKYMSSILSLNVEGFFHLVSVEEPIYGKMDLNMVEMFGPGMILTMCHILPMLMSGLHLILDRKNSCLERILVAGVQPLEIFVANILQILFLIFTQLPIILFLAFYVYGVTQNGSFIDVYLLLFLTGVQGMAMGFLFALFVKDVTSAIVNTLVYFLYENSYF